MRDILLFGIFAAFVLAGCLSSTPAQQPPVEPEYCFNVSQTVPVTEEICSDVSSTEDVCGLRSLPYTYTDVPKEDLCISSGDCAGKPLSQCPQCGSAMTRCIKVIENEDLKATGTWTVAANFTFGDAGFNKEPVTAIIPPNSSYAFDFYQIYTPGYPINSAQCNLVIVQEGKVNDCHQETRTRTDCQNVTHFENVENSICQ